MAALQLLVLVLATAEPAQDAPLVTSPAAPSVAAPAHVPAPVAPAPPPTQASPAEPPPPPAPSRHIDDPSQSFNGAVPQGPYELGVQGAFSRAENLKGPLDGAWVLKDTGGRSLFRFQLDDPGYRGGPVQGAFQDLAARRGVIGASGFVDAVKREGNSLVLDFRSRGQDAVVSLEVQPGGTFAGRLSRGGASREVTLARP